MLYGTRPWALALKNAASLLQDEEDEEGMVLVDFEDGRGVVLDRDVRCVYDGGSDSDAATAAAEEIGGLVERAVAKIEKWNLEVGERVGAVLSELQELL